LVLGRAEVREIFRVPKVGAVGGCYVIDGKVLRSAQVRLLRDGTVVHEGPIASLRRFKDDVREVLSGFECGIGLDKFNDIKVGDIFEVFTEEEVKAS
jgi:translation initiation factor IF-2